MLEQAMLTSILKKKLDDIEGTKRSNKRSGSVFSSFGRKVDAQGQHSDDRHRSMTSDDMQRSGVGNTDASEHLLL